MKYIVLILLLLSQVTFLQAQEKDVNPQIKVFKQEIEILLKQELESKRLEGYLSDLEEQIISDTFRIEKLLSKNLIFCYSTFEVVDALTTAKSDYDKLLNKYYKLLLNKLDDTDKEILRQSQRNWIKFRDSENSLNKLLTEGRYSGGGTIQSIILTDRSLELTKNRVLELCEYLMRVIENKDDI